MQKQIITILLIIAGCSFSPVAFAQNDAEQQVRTYLDRIQYWRYQYSPEDSGLNPNSRPEDSIIASLDHRLIPNPDSVNPSDSLKAANYELFTFLMNGNAASIQPSKVLEDAGLIIVSSDDKNLRIYSWNTETGDEQHKYSSVSEYKTASGIKTVANAGISQFIQMYSISSGKKYYLAVYSNILSVKDAMKGVEAFVINEDKLEKAKIFRVGGELTDKIEYTYDYSANFSFKKMKEEHVIHFEKQKLYIPEVKEDKITGNILVYVFDGNEFVIDNNSK